MTSEAANRSNSLIAAARSPAARNVAGYIPQLMKRGAYITLFVLLTGCSSAPEKQYQVKTYQQMSQSLMEQADTKRQLEQFEQALLLYRKAEAYGAKRHDKTAVGIAKLKRAAIHIRLQAYGTAKQLMAEVAEMNRLDGAGLTHPLSFIEARLAYAQGDIVGAVQRVAELEETYRHIPEKSIYYRIVKWGFQPDSVDYSVIQQDLQMLDKLLSSRKLQNIEIYSYALFRHADWLAQQRRPEFEAALQKAIEHFSSLELTAKIRNCYRLGADYYQAAGQHSKANYYRRQANALDGVLAPDIQP